MRNEPRLGVTEPGMSSPLSARRLLLGACLSLAGLSAAAAPAGAAVIKLGEILPSGASGAKGVQLAVDQANAARLVPGVSFRLVAATSGAAAVKGLVGDAQVAGVVGAADTASALAELPLANAASLASVSPSATETCLTVTGALGCTGAAAHLAQVQPTGRTTFFRVAPADALQGAALADFVAGVRKARVAYLVDDGTPAGAAQAATFISRWQDDFGVLSGHGTAAHAGGSDVNLLTMIAATKPDAIVFAGSDAGAVATLLQQLPLVPGLNTTTFVASSALHQATPPAVRGLVWSVAPEPQLEQLPAAAAFTSAYRARFGAASEDAARGYDAAETLLRAVKAAVAGGATPPATARSAPTAFRAAVVAAVGHGSFGGANGPIAFAADGDLAQGPIEVDQLGAGGWSPAAVQSVAGPAPSVALSPSVLDFGSLTIHGLGATLSLKVTNAGVAPFAVSALPVGGAGFTVVSTNCLTANVVAGASCSAVVRFAPPAAGVFKTTIGVAGVAGAGTATLIGTGVAPAPLVVTTTTLQRGAVAVPYRAMLAAAGGVRPYRWSIAAGALAPGLTLNAVTGEVTGTPSRTGTFSATVQVTDSANPGAQTARRQLAITIAPPVPATVFVVNGANSSVRGFSLPPVAGAAPATVLAGPATQLNGTAGVAVDGTGGIYVANANANSVTAYPPGATGNAQPTSVLAGPATELTDPVAVALDGDERIYVANQAAGTVTVYAAGVQGNTAPIRTITGLAGPDAVVVDAAGNLWVSQAGANSIARFAPGDARPAVTIAGPATGLNGPQALALDAAGDVLVANQFAGTVAIFAPAAAGDAAPVGTIGGPATGLSFPGGVDVDAHGNVYASNQIAGTITVYPPSARGNVAPAATIGGPASGLGGPGRLAVTPPLTILNRTLAPARAGHRYRARVTAALGVAPYRWAAHHLPRGLRLHAGVISGRPARAGRVRIRLTVTDAAHPASRATRRLTLNVRH